MKPTSPLLYLADLVQSFRTTLWSLGFVELPTALIHEHDPCPIFQRVRLEDGRHLKESGGLALRCNLAYASKIFEIAHCARRDPVDDIHLQQFTMLDLYEAGATLEDAIQLCRELVTSVYVGSTATCSVAEHIKANLGVDLVNDPDSEAKLKLVLSRKYQKPHATLYSLVDSYMTDEIEPLSQGQLVVVTDVPRVTESAGRQTPNAVATAKIAEFHINGMEVAQLIEDEPDPDSYVKRAQAQGHYGPEVKTVVQHILDGKIPSRSAGFGIGLERLAMAATGLKDIREFMPSRDFIREL